MKQEKELKRLIKDSTVISAHLHNFFEGDVDKIWKWLFTPNPGLGNLIPAKFYMNGRTKKLLKFVTTSVCLNRPHIHIDDEALFIDSDGELHVVSRIFDYFEQGTNYDCEGPDGWETIAGEPEMLGWSFLDKWPIHST